MPNVQARVPAQVSNYSRASNPVQVSYSQTASFQQQSAKVTASKPLGMQSQQGRASWQMWPQIANILQTTGYNNVAGPHATTLNSPQVRNSQPVGAAMYAQVSQNQYIPISSLPTTQVAGNQPLVGGAYSGVYDTAIERNAINYNTLSTQQATRPNTLNQSTGQRLNLNTAALTTQNQLLAHSSASLTHQTLASAQSTSHNSSPAQFVGALQHATRQQTFSTSSMQVSANARSRIRDAILAASLPSRMVYNRVTAPQHKEGLPLQNQASPPVGSQVQQHTFQNSQQSLGTCPQSRGGYNQGTVPQQTGGLRTQHQVQQREGSQAMPLTQTISSLSRNSTQPLGTFPQRREGYNQVALPRQTGGFRAQPVVSQPEASQANLHSQPVQQSNVSRMTGQRSDQTSSSSRTSSTDNELADRLRENELERRATAHVEALSLYNEVRLVYSELQKSLNEGTCKQKQSSTTQEPRSLEHQLGQLPTNKTTPPSNKQPPDAARSTNSLSSGSEQSPLCCHTSANQLPSQASPTQSLSNSTQKRAVRFSQEADSNTPVGAFPGNADGSSRLESSTVRQTDGEDQASSKQDALCRLSVDNDPYKVPPKTPSGALEEIVKKLLNLQNKIATTENVSGTGHVSSNSLDESMDGTSKADNTTESQEPKQSLGMSQSTASSERDSNNESLKHYSKSPEHNSPETVSLNQGTDTQGLLREQHDNNCSLSGNQYKATEDTSVSPSSHNVLDTDFDKMQTDSEPPSSVPDGNNNGTKHFPATEEEEQDSNDGDGQGDSVGDRQDSDYAENDNSSQDIYSVLMSPIIPQMAAARRVRSCSDAHTTEDTTSISSIASAIKNGNSDDHNMEPDPEPKQTSDDRDQGFKDSQPEGIRTCATVPSADVHCNQQSRRSDSESKSEQENLVKDQEHVPLSSDVTVGEMQLEEGTQVYSTGGIVTDLSDSQQAACNTKFQEIPRTNLPEEQLSTEFSEGQRELPASVPASDGPCMGGVAQANKVGNDEQYEECQLNPKAIPKQNFVCLNSTFLEKPYEGNFEEIKKALLKENVDENGVCREFNNKNTPINNEPSSPLHTSPLPVPRLAIRVMNGNTVIMWDLPPDNKITDISFFEIYVFLKNKDGRLQRNHTDRWIKLGEMKAMSLPMGCTLRHVIQENVIYSFIVRAVDKNGLPGPISKPCCLGWL